MEEGKDERKAEVNKRTNKTKRKAAVDNSSEQPTLRVRRIKEKDNVGIV
jgi:hypothetical protein